MHVIGTAGHVDHGKSSLVLALTGIDPDRLAEEKAREMTIYLGFAWLGLPGGETVGIVDVPGHRDFIDNMLAGISGIDLALVVIAADEGVMPQTREHLAIIDLLEIPCGVIALTKIDMLTEPGRLDAVRAEVSACVAGTMLENAAVIPVSARTGDGLEALVAAIEAALESCPARVDRGLPRLPIDRVFSMKGFGTVVTGTLGGGMFSVGDEVEIVPRGTFARVRGLQSHRQATQTAQPGSRVAINLSGVGIEEIGRGDVVALPGVLRGTQLIDVRFRQHRASGRALHHNDSVRFFSGAADMQAQVRLLGSEETTPGDDFFIQLRLGAPLALDKGDRFILRWPSPADTVGGGIILDAHPAHRWRRFKAEVLARFERLAEGSPEDVLLDALQMRAAAQIGELVTASGMTIDEVEGVLGRMADSGAVIDAGDGWWMSRTRWDRVMADMKREIAGYHAEYPLKGGMSTEALRSRLGIEMNAFNQIVVMASGNGTLGEVGALVRLADHRVVFSEAQERQIEALNAIVRSSPASTPSLKEAEAMVGGAVMDALVEMGQIVRVRADVWFDGETYQRLVGEVRGYIAEHGAITVAGARDLFGTSRKYATALLEHLDEIGATMRSGDTHVLRSRASGSDQQPEGDQHDERADHQADEYSQGQDDDDDG